MAVNESPVRRLGTFQGDRVEMAVAGKVVQRGVGVGQ
jgi:hypothetical protein